jgi:hypothetical protein
MISFIAYKNSRQKTKAPTKRNICGVSIKPELWLSRTRLPTHCCANDLKIKMPISHAPNSPPPSPPSSPPHKTTPLRQILSTEGQTPPEDSMYSPTAKPGLCHDGYYHPKPATANLAQHLLNCTHSGIPTQRLPSPVDFVPKAQQTHLDFQLQARYVQERQNGTRMYAAVQNIAEAQTHDQQPQQRQDFERRRIELRSDPSALFRHYSEYMVHFPVPKGDCPNPYHMGLLANQEMPDDRQSERAVAIEYAKAHWENAWEDRKDYEFVIELIREESKKKEDKVKPEAMKQAGESPRFDHM